MDDDKAPWLNPAQQSIWRNWLATASHINSHLETGLRKYGLDLAQYEILVRLSEADAWRLRMSDLAGDVHQSRSRLTHTISRMEAQGLATRTTCADDGRGVWATLTQEGYDLIVRVAPHHVATVRRVFVDAIEPGDLIAMGRAMESVLAVAD